MITVKVAKVFFNTIVKILCHCTVLDEMAKDKTQEGYMSPGRLFIIEIKEKQKWK